MPLLSSFPPGSAFDYPLDFGALWRISPPSFLPFFSFSTPLGLAVWFAFLTSFPACPLASRTPSFPSPPLAVNLCWTPVFFTLLHVCLLSFFIPVCFPPHLCFSGNLHPARRLTPLVLLQLTAPHFFPPFPSFLPDFWDCKDPPF